MFPAHVPHRLLGLLLLGLLAGTRAAAAVPPAVVVDNEAALLVQQLVTAVADGDSRAAISLAERIHETHATALVAAEPAGTYRQAGARAAELLARLPADGAELYRQRFDAEVEARWQAARAAGDWPALAALFARHRLSRHWAQLGAELAAWQLDRGRPDDALETLTALHAAGAAGPALRAQRAVALALGGAPATARAALAELQPGDLAEGEQAAVDAVAAWLAERDAQDAAPTAALPLLTSALPWRVPLVMPADEWLETDSEIAEVAGGQQHWPLARVTPAGDQPHEAWRARRPPHPLAPAGDTLYVRQHGRLTALDAQTLVPRWTVASVYTADVSGTGRFGAFGSFRTPVGPPLLSSPAGRRLLHDAMAHACAADATRVYTIETLMPDDGTVPPGVPLRARVLEQLVARDAATGEVLWRVDTGLGEGAFAGPPVVVGDAVVIAFRSPPDVLLGVLDAATGALRGRCSVATARGTAAEKPGLLAAAGDTVYFASGLGTLVAVDVSDGTAPHRRWVYAYAAEDGAAPRQADDALLCDGDTVYFAPPDAPLLLALDRFAGAPRWQQPRPADERLVARVAGGVVLAGAAVRCVDAATGALAWSAAPLTVTGRPVVRGPRLYVPTREGLAVLDVDGGRIIADQWEPNAGDALAPPANLADTPLGLLALAPRTLERLPDAAALAAAAEAASSDAVAALLSARLAAARGDLDAAAEQLATTPFDDAALAAVRDELLAELLARLATDGDAAPRALSWLTQLSTSTDAPAAAAQGRLLLADQLARDGLLVEALNVLGDVLTGELGGAPVPADGGALTHAAWLAAAQRGRAWLGELPPDRRDVAARALVEAALRHETPTALRRAADTLPEGPWRQALGLALTLWTAPDDPGVVVPAEVLLPYLPDDDAVLPPEVRRRLALRRWETLVTMRRVTAADDAARLWDTLTADDPNDRPSDPAERVRVRRVSAAHEALATPPADFTPATLARRWLIAEATLLPLSATGPVIDDGTLILRAAEPRRLLRVEAATGATRGEWPDQLEPQADTPGADTRRVWSELFAASDDVSADARRPAADEQIIAVPVRGGLLAIGRGSWPGGGQRLWTHGVAEWRDGPPLDAVVVTPAGVLVLAGPHRLLCLDPADGSRRWERRFEPTPLERLHAVGDHIALQARDGRIGLLAAIDDTDLRWLPDERLAGVAACGDTLIVWTAREVSGLDPTDGTPRWTQPLDGRSPTLLHERGWIAIPAAAADGWRLHDATTGAAVGAGEFGPLPPDVLLLAADNERILAVHGAPAAPRLTAFDVATGQAAWSTEIPADAIIDASQLAAHPHYIVLITSPPVPPATPAPLRLGLLDKRTGAGVTLPGSDGGSAAEWLTLDGLRAGSWSGAPLRVSVTAARVIVSVDGRVAAFGRGEGDLQ